MRIAVLADIHGNLRALEAVQADLRKQSPDLVVNLGDHVSGPLQAAATADALMGAPYIHIRGNHDRQLVDRPVEQMGASDRAAYGQLDERHRAWLRSLPPAREIEGILLCHGSPSDDLQYLLEDVHQDGVFLTPAHTVQERLGGREGLVLCGHSHIPRAVANVVNPGSVGLPAYDDDQPFRHYMETGSPHARYALLDCKPMLDRDPAREPGGWRIQFIAVEYDWNAAAEDARRAQRPDWAHALATGYALRTAARGV
jgi:putative phosphoesterase